MAKYQWRRGENDQLLNLGNIDRSNSQKFDVFAWLNQNKNLAESAEFNPRLDEELRAALQELNSLVGLQKVKSLVNEILAFTHIQKRRRKRGLNTMPVVLHMVFKGNPGTGKTTVARIFGRVFKEMDILAKGHLIEVERADLVGEYIGHTAQRTKKKIAEAEGGILFIDEAYALGRGGEKDFGKEAVDTLVKAMEDDRYSFIVILAGYKKEMEYFLQTNSGIRSRFPIIINFPDYSVRELVDIAKMMLKERDYQLTGKAKDVLAELLGGMGANRSRLPGNARTVRNLIEKAIRKQALRLAGEAEIGRRQLIYITARDIENLASGRAEPLGVGSQNVQRRV